MNRSAVVFGLVTMVSWGLWTTLANTATRSLTPAVAAIISYGVSVVVAVGYVWLFGEAVSLSVARIGFAVVAGLFAGIGAVSFYAGMDVGRRNGRRAVFRRCGRARDRLPS